MSSRIVAFLVCFVACVGVSDADGPRVEAMLKLSPVMDGISVATPQLEQIAELEVRTVGKGDTTGWELVTKDGTVLRRFIDTNGDRKIDRWIYFLDGREVYRDVDKNGDGIADQAIQRHYLIKDEQGKLAVATGTLSAGTAKGVTQPGKKTPSTDKAEKSPSKQALSGLVTFRGQPVEGRILIHAVDNQILGCPIDDNGRYEIKRVPQGTFRVTIEGVNVPERYSNPDNGLTIEIHGGKNVLDFELTAE